ncbi:MAG: DUF2141 domain-containing protein [Candidatus Wallbacteria bacterium]|nr:DUF2141 domain-containing protein [Candidatus Wallbacteria bacterium]
MKTKIVVAAVSGIALVFLLAGAAAVTAQNDARPVSRQFRKKFGINFKVTGFPDRRGFAYVALFHSAEGYASFFRDERRRFPRLFSPTVGFPEIMDEAIAIRKYEISEDLTISDAFSGLPQGYYAVSTWHDQNRNNRFEIDPMGIPDEPWGVSLNSDHLVRLPSFNEARFRLECGTAEIVIYIRH